MEKEIKKGMTRRQSRECAVSLIFAQFYSPEKTREELISDYRESHDEKPGRFAKELFNGVCDNVAELDEMIREAAENWKLSRISRVLRAILRICVYEIIYMPDIGREISINEALELARIYDDEKAVAFVNGVIAGIVNK